MENSHIALIRPVLNEYFDGPREIRELILKFVCWPLEGKYYTLSDMMSIPVDTTCLFVMNLQILYVYTGFKMDKKHHTGEVNVIRDDNDKFKIKFEMDGDQHEFVRGKYYPHGLKMIIFPPGPGEEMKMINVTIGLLPYKLE